MSDKQMFLRKTLANGVEAWDCPICHATIYVVGGRVPRIIEHEKSHEDDVPRS